MAERLVVNANYLMAMVLFAVGLYIMLARSNLIKKIIGLNIMETAVFLFIIALGYVHDGAPSIDPVGAGPGYVHPLPSALVLTGIVIAVSTTAYALSLVIRVYDRMGTIDAHEIARRSRGD
jgi:multicomponent Na+:H+ antiporter subunit C